MESDRMEQRHIDGICHYGKVKDYKEEVSTIVRAIWENGFPVFLTWYREDESSTKWHLDGTPIEVRIRIKNESLGLPIIWSLLHEFGHILDGYTGDPKTKPPDEQMNREKQAWENAKKELTKYPRLQEKEKEFENYREYCLDTYRRYLKDKYGVNVK